MPRRHRRRTVAVAIALSAGLVGVVQEGTAREVTCESQHSRHAYCPTGPHGAVRVMQSYGRPECIEGRSWGTDSNGIWVDQGCYAKFYVEEPGSSSSDRHREKAIAGAALGALVVGALIAGSHSQRENAAPPVTSNPPVSPAQVGRFQGYNIKYRADITLDVESSGRVYYYASGQQAPGWIRDNRIVFDNGTSYFVENTGSGFVLRRDGEPDNVVAFHRVR